jgi:hypothetical protein
MRRVGQQQQGAGGLSWPLNMTSHGRGYVRFSMVIFVGLECVAAWLEAVIARRSATDDRRTLSPGEKILGEGWKWPAQADAGTGSPMSD